MLVSGDSLLSGLLAYQLTNLQVLQNTAASLISFTRKYDHITPVLKSLHWLPVNYQIIFKIYYWSSKYICNMVPFYFHDGLHYRTYSRSLRSTSTLCRWTANKPNHMVILPFLLQAHSSGMSSLYSLGCLIVLVILRGSFRPTYLFGF